MFNKLLPLYTDIYSNIKFVHFYLNLNKKYSIFTPVCLPSAIKTHKRSSGVLSVHC